LFNISTLVWRREMCSHLLSVGKDGLAFSDRKTGSFSVPRRQKQRRTIHTNEKVIQADSCPVLSNTCEMFISIGHRYVHTFEVYVHA
jgi:hypothetical protein